MVAVARVIFARAALAYMIAFSLSAGAAAKADSTTTAMALAVRAVEAAQVVALTAQARRRAAPARQRVTAETAARSIAVGAAGQVAPEAIKTDRPEPMVRSERAVQELSEAEAMVVAEAAAVTTAAVEVVVAAVATVTTLVAVGAEAAARHTSNRRRENTKVGEVGRPPQETVSSSLVGNE
jgi:hypothetical protein